MSKFTYEVLMNEDTTTICFNKAKYTKEESIRLAKEELEDYGDDFEVEIRTGFVKHGFYSFDGEVFNGWNIDFSQTKKRKKNEVEVWVVEAHYE